MGGGLEREIVLWSIISRSCHKYHFCRNKKIVMTKDVFCRNKSMIVTTKLP